MTVANNHPVFSKLDVTQPSPLDFHLFNLRVDGQLGQRHGAFLRASLDRNDASPRPARALHALQLAEARTRALQLQGGLTSVLGRQLANEPAALVRASSTTTWPR